LDVGLVRPSYATDAPTELAHISVDLSDLDVGSLMHTTWRNRAACLNEVPELFFPVGNAGAALG